MSTDVDTSGNKAAGKGDKTEKVSFKVPESESTMTTPPNQNTMGTNKAIVAVLLR
jgi:hypothetical protein